VSTPNLKKLSKEQFAQFDDLGYVMVPDVFDPGDLDPLRDEIAGLVDVHARELIDEGKLDPEWRFADESFETQLARITAADVDAGREVMARIKGKGGGGHCGPAMFDVIRHEKLLNAIEDFIGPEIVGSSVYRIRPKVPKISDGVVPWHQDSGYLLKHCDTYLIVTCWIPLVPATAENGCLQVLPGVHRNGIIRHFKGGNAGFLVIVNDDLPDDVEPVTVEVPLGGVLFMTNLTPHQSIPNTTGGVRWSIDLRYQSASLPNNIGIEPEELAAIVADDPEVEIACYPPEADFVIRSPSHPEREIRTVEQFSGLRARYEKVQTPAVSPVRWTESVAAE